MSELCECCQKKVDDDNGRDLRDKILATVRDLVGDFLYYDRKEDEDLPVDAIQNAIKSGVITVDDIVDSFGRGIEEGS